jgi:hypothetical protein
MASTYDRTKFDKPYFSRVLVIAIKGKAEGKFRAVTKLKFIILKRLI